jgi:beta-1,4-mannooligosaccharide/beta-1,4-mannosyl-N-acetylglucosamine phosphorylase
MERSPNNPILTRDSIPPIPPDLLDVTSVFNPGAIKHNNTYILLTRVQSRSRETSFVLAESPDGEHFTMRNEIVRFEGMEKIGKRVYHVYDPRMTRLDEVVYIMFAMDMEGACHLGLACTKDFTRFTFLGITTDDDTRNGVLFPEQVGGRYLRMERPNRSDVDGGVRTGSTIWLSESDDLLHWRRVGPVISGRFHYWDEYVGSGPPPVKTRQGWLHLYHGIATHFGSSNIYQAGVVLLDLHDPRKVIGRCRCNILEPRELYELTGQVPNVVFPSGMIVEHYDEEGFALPDSSVNVYYGAADTVIGLATTTVQDLVLAAFEGEIPPQGV